jgi:hypothetical protein
MAFGNSFNRQILFPWDKSVIRPGLVDNGSTVQPGSVAPMSTGDGADVSAPPATAAQQALAASTIPADYSTGTYDSGGMGPPPSSAMAQALLQNEEDIPLKTPFAALGKLGALWGAQHAGQDYTNKMYERQVAPARALSQALAGIPANTSPSEYRRRAGQAYMAVGGRFGNADMVEQGAQLASAPTNYIQMKDAAGNDYLVNPYDPTDVRKFDENGNLVRQGMPPGGLSPAGASGGTATPGGAPSAQGVPAVGDPYAQYTLPVNIPKSTDTDMYRAYLAQMRKMHPEGPPADMKDFNAFSLDRSRAGAIQQSITVDPQKKAGDVLADSVAKRYSGLIEGVEGAIGRQRDLHAMQGALQRIQAAGGTTGLGQGEITDLQNAINVGANALGLDQQFDISDKEFLSKFNRQLAGQAAKSAVGARVTNFEISNYLKSNPGLELSTQGNTRLLGIMDQIEQRNIDLGNALGAAAEDAVSHGKTIDLPAMHKIVAEYDAAHHIVDPVTKQDLSVNVKLPEFHTSGGKTGAEGAAPPPVPGAPSGDFLGILPK